MAQLHMYVPDSVAETIRRRAEAKRMTVSRYLADLVKSDTGPDWPEGYFDTVVGGWEGEPMTRPPQGTLEARDAFDVSS